MTPNDHIAVQIWSKEQLLDERLRGFVIRNRVGLLQVLSVADATDRSPLTKTLMEEWVKERDKA